MRLEPAHVYAIWYAAYSQGCLLYTSYEGIENILALRGDRNQNVPAKEDFLHASDLIKYIKDTTGDQFCIAGACYPDIHPEAADTVSYTHLLCMCSRKREQAMDRLSVILPDFMVQNHLS